MHVEDECRKSHVQNVINVWHSLNTRRVYGDGMWRVLCVCDSSNLSMVSNVCHKEGGKQEHNYLPRNACLTDLIQTSQTLRF